MKSRSGHPDDEALEQRIATAAIELMHAHNRNARAEAWELLRALHAQRSRREIAAREAAMRAPGFLHV